LAEATHLLGLPLKHKPKDIKPQGAGSGLDADKVDGLHANELGGGGPHASSHEAGGGDKVHFADLEHDEGDTTLHDAFTAAPHISQTDKDKIHDRLHALDSASDHSGVITDAQHGDKTTIPNAHHSKMHGDDQHNVTYIKDGDPVSISDVTKVIVQKKIDLAATGVIHTPASGKKIRLKAFVWSSNADIVTALRFGTGGDLLFALQQKGVIGMNLIGANVEGAVNEALYGYLSGTGTIKGTVLLEEI